MTATATTTPADLLREAGPLLYRESRRTALNLGLDPDDVLGLAIRAVGLYAHRFDAARGKPTTFVLLLVKSAVARIMGRRRRRVGHPAIFDDAPFVAGLADSSPTALAADRSPGPLDRVIQREDRQRLRRAIRRLPDREREVIKRRFGFGRPAELQEQIAADWGCTRARVGQVETTAVARLATFLAGSPPRRVRRTTRRTTKPAAAAAG